METFGHVNWLAVIAATLTFAGLGALWFTFVVPRYDQAAPGRARADKREQTPRDYGIQLASLMAMTATSAVLMRAFNVHTNEAAAQFGLLIGLGYLVPMALLGASNPNSSRPVMVGLLNAPFFLLGSIVSNVLLVAMS